jgi:major outer membrane protein
MKKLFIASLIIFACNGAYALPVGNPAEPTLLLDALFFGSNCEKYYERSCIDPCYSWTDAISIRLGFYGDYVFNRHLGSSEDDNRFEIDRTEISTNAAYLVLNFCDRLDLFTTLGASNFDLHTHINAGVSNVGLHVNTSSQFSWSVGARAILLEYGCTTLGIEGQYFTTNPDINYVRLAESVTIYPTRAPFHYREGQVGVGIAHRLENVVPYIALKWSKARVHSHQDGIDGALLGFPNLKNSKNWGYAFGLTFIGCEKMSLTAEGRFADEKALYVNGQVRF